MNRKPAKHKHHYNFFNSEDVLRSVTDTFIAYDRAWRYVYINMEAEKLIGRKAKDLLGKVVWDVFPQAKQTEAARYCLLAAKTGKTQQIQTYFAPLGKWFDMKIFPSAEGVVTYLRDITAERKAAELLKESELRFRAAFHQSAIAMSIADREGGWLSFNTAYTKMFGYTEKELKTMHPRDFLHPEDIQKSAALYQELVLGKIASFTQERRYIHKNKSLVYGIVHATAIRDTQGKLRYVAVVIEDVTVKRMAEQRQSFLDGLNAKLVTRLDNRTVMRDIAALIVSFLADYCRIALIDSNNTISEITVTHSDPKQAMLAEHLYDQYKEKAYEYGVPHMLKTGKSELLALIDEAVFALIKENTSLTKSQRLIGLKSYMGVPLKVQGAVVGAITFSSVQENRFYTKEDLRFAEEIARRVSLTLENIRLYKEAKKAVLLRDDFISMASHELKTPLTTLKLFAQSLQQRPPSEEMREHIVKKMGVSIEKLIALVGDMLDLSKIQQGKLAVSQGAFYIKPLVDEVLADLQPTTVHKLLLQWKTKLPVYADRERIRQVLVNLLTNAVKYSPKGKQVIVFSKKRGKYIQVGVQDFGIGIAKEDQQRIFQRFYQAGKDKTYPGLGLGLYIASEIIKQHGGTMWVESSKGKGSIFYFTLPTAKLS